MHLIFLSGFWVVHITCVHISKFLAQFPVDNLLHPVVSSLIYSLCTNLLHSINMWLAVSSLSPYNLHLLFRCVLSIRYFDIVFIEFFCAALKRDSVSILRFPFLSHLQVFLCEISCSKVFFSSQARSGYLSHFSLSFSFTLWSAWMIKSTVKQVLFYCWLSLGLVIWLRLGYSFVSQNLIEFYTSHFLGWILGCAHAICLYVQI